MRVREGLAVMLVLGAAVGCGPKPQTETSGKSPLDAGRGSSSDATAKATAAPAATATPAATADPSDPPGPTICGEVRIAPELAAKVKPDAVLFIFAKPQPGGGPPTAVVRHAASFPARFCLSQKNTMVPSLRFEGTQYITARVEFDDNVGATSGDLEGKTKQAVAVGTNDLVLTIDTVRP